MNTISSDTERDLTKVDTQYVDAVYKIFGNKLMGVALYATGGFLMPYTFGQAHGQNEATFLYAMIVLCNALSLKFYAVNTIPYYNQRQLALQQATTLKTTGKEL